MTQEDVDKLLVQVKETNKALDTPWWRLEYHEPSKQVHIEPLSNPTPFTSGWVTLGSYETYTEASEAARRHQA
tara:strand:- start:205 stop:423 length:219 start_codon:yes stop_codon:yes gene_type:complete